MKDYFDLRYILRTESPEPEQITNAVRRTFEARKTGIPTVLPVGFSDDFAKFKEDMWLGFLKRNRLSVEADFEEVVLFVRAKLHLDWT
ncbi:MAG TPA: nucleotidyl transferase AbiEii/AbiGii toxin family protein [Oceanipulchritudo sp.]|nr:nucleotidyl transferase AbiEii/AbiGii toxin family protein [Oceanipulchritudo sp.]